MPNTYQDFSNKWHSKDLIVVLVAPIVEAIIIIAILFAVYILTHLHQDINNGIQFLLRFCKSISWVLILAEAIYLAESLSTCKNQYIIKNGVLYIKENFFLRKPIDLKIPLSEISEVRMIKRKKSILRTSNQLELMVDTLPLDLHITNHKQELYNYLNSLQQS